MTKISSLSSALIISLAIALPAAAISFDGLQNGEQVLNYYNGGFGGNGSGPGPNAGITFSNGLAASSVVIAFGPSAVLTAPSVTMDLANPFAGPVSFYYAGAGGVTFYSGLDGTGNVVNSSSLPNQGAFSFPFGANVGQFESVVFTGSGLRLDSVTLGGFVIPEPATPALVFIGLGLMILGRLRMRSRRV